MFLAFVVIQPKTEPAATGAVIMDLHNHLALVLGRADYCGVVKKTMFTVMNFALPNVGQLSMHCSANVDRQNNSAHFVWFVWHWQDYLVSRP